jgi:UDP-N-acetylbacillosamine N-acetyltransferase
MKQEMKQEMKEGLLILGFGGHARSVAGVALDAGVRSLRFVDRNARDGETFLGFPVEKQYSGPLPAGWSALAASGDNHQRQQQIQDILDAGWTLETLISPCATISVGSTIAPGCFIAHHAHIGPMATIGQGCIINTGAVVEHDCTVGDYTHVSVNSTVAGRSKLGDFVFLGTGATVIDSVTIGDEITIGAGGVVIRALSQPGTYVGVPVRSL